MYVLRRLGRRVRAMMNFMQREQWETLLSRDQVKDERKVATSRACWFVQSYGRGRDIRGGARAVGGRGEPARSVCCCTGWPALQLCSLRRFAMAGLGLKFPFCAHDAVEVKNKR